MPVKTFELAGLLKASPDKIGDERGYFAEIWPECDFLRAAGLVGFLAGIPEILPSPSRMTPAFQHLLGCGTQGGWKHHAPCRPSSKGWRRPMAVRIQPSARGELDITDIDRTYLKAWKADAGGDGAGPDSLLKVSEVVATVECDRA